MTATIKRYFLIVLMVILIMPLLFVFIPVNDRELNGVVEHVSVPVLATDSWLDGDFQKGFESYFSFNLGLRKAAVRTASQINYWLGVQRNEVIVGKQNELMGKECIDALYGRDFIGEDSICRTVRSIKRFQQLLNQNDVKFFVVIAPNKSRLYRDKIPDSYKGEDNARTNYSVFKRQLEDVEVPVVDFQQWFEQIDKKSPYPLYSNLGLHWSYYSATFCGDSLLGFIADLLGKKANHVVYKEVNVTNIPYGTDKDLMELMNLWFDIPLSKPLAYFKTELKTDSSAYVPSVLAVGDSYYWNIIYSGIPAAFYQPNSAYFYYNSTAYNNNGSTDSVKDMDLIKTVLEKDVVFYIYSEPNLKNIGNGIDRQFLYMMDSLKRTTVPSM